MEDVSLKQYVNWYSQVEVAKQLDKPRQRIWTMLNREEWRLKLGPDRKIVGYYKLIRV